MALIKKMLGLFNGLYYSQDYLCFAHESFQPILHAYVIKDGRIEKNITTSHLFTGYSPVIFALTSDSGVAQSSPLIEIAFSHTLLKTNDILPASVALAMLSFKRIRDWAQADITISFYECVYGWHRFLSGPQQWIGQLQNHLYNRKPGNVFLAGNLYKQVQIAYAVPRKICLITVGDHGLYNQFPTDLHGMIDEKYYVISLRQGGKACEQVEATGRVMLSDMRAEACKKVFALGKNHMQPLREKGAFAFSGDLSDRLQLPLPVDMIAYTELELISSFPHGIHRILIFKIIHQHKNDGQDGTLVHIHNSYASWRHKMRMESNYILR